MDEREKIGITIGVVALALTVLGAAGALPLLRSCSSSCRSRLLNKEAAIREGWRHFSVIGLSPRQGGRYKGALLIDALFTA